MLQDILDLMGDRLLDNSSRGAFDGSFKAGSQEFIAACLAAVKFIQLCFFRMNDSRSQGTTRVTWQHVYRMSSIQGPCSTVSVDSNLHEFA